MLSHPHLSIPRPHWIITALTTIFLVIMWLLPFSVHAKPTSPEQAQRLVTNWLARDGRPLDTLLGRQVVQVQPFRDAADQVIYYAVYLAPQGFVIVTAEDLVEPIIAFAPTGKFDPATDNPLGALISRDVPYRVQRAREVERQGQSLNSAFPPPGSLEQARRKWETLTFSRKMQAPSITAGIPTVSDLWVAPLLQSRWFQTYESGIYCYNYYTPNHYACGCVATALSQIMLYHRFPTAAMGTPSFSIKVDDDWTNRNLRGGDGYGGPYEWDNMVLDPDVHITEVQRQAIGTLCYDAGVAAHMQYSVEGSGAYSSDAQAALLSPFGYSNAVIASDYDGWGLTGSGLLPMLNPNLDAGLPVYLGISNDTVAHAIVADGYGYDSTTLYHHLNLGLAGSGDAWYNLPTVDPESITFTSVKDCIYNIFPTGSGEIISGRVTDAKSQPLADVIVSATGQAGGTYTANTNVRGIYALAKIPSSSTYTIQASKAGITFTPPRVISVGSSASPPSSPGNCWGINFSEAIPLSQALDNYGLEFSTSGDTPWFGQTAVSYYGGGAAQSGDITQGQCSNLQTTVRGPGKVSFYWKISSGSYFDFLEFYLDSSLGASITGEVNWEQRTFEVPQGKHTLRWTYSKNVTNSIDSGWVDRVVYTSPGGILSSIMLLLLRD